MALLSQNKDGNANKLKKYYEEYYIEPASKKEKEQTIRQVVQNESKPTKKKGTKQGLYNWLSKQPPCFGKHRFNNIVLKRSADLYALVLPCEGTTWVLKKTRT